MHPLLRTFNFYGLSMLLGNLLYWCAKLISPSLLFLMDFNSETIILLLIFTSIISIPTLVPCVIFYFLQKKYWNSFITRIASAFVHATFISLAWALLLNFTFSEAGLFYNITPFILAAPLSAVITELWYDHKHPENFEKL